MNPKKQILEFIKQSLSNASSSSAVMHSDEAGKHALERERVQEIFDGMSTGTARIVIDREVGRRISEKYDVQGIDNKGRYYVATIVQKEDHTIATLLIDKQNGNVQFIKGAWWIWMGVTITEIGRDLH